MLSDAARRLETPRGVEVWWLPPSEVPAAEQGDVDVLDDGERRRLERLQRPEDRRAFTQAHALLRELLATRLGVGASEIRFDRRPCPRCGGPHGRPVVSWPPPQADAPVEFSLSRSSGLVVVGLAPGPIGVDAEAIGDARTAMSVSGLLSEAEHAVVREAPEADRPAVFTRLWARKEAYLKAVGIGIAAEHALTEPGPGEGDTAGADGRGEPRAGGGTGAGGGAGGGTGWILSDFDVIPGYVAAVAIRSGDAAG